MSELRTGVDLGGTKIEAVVLDLEGEILVRVRRATPAEDYNGTVQAIVDLVGIVEAEAGMSAGHVGVGTPGSLSPQTGLIRNANSTCLNGQPLDRDLAEALGRPVRLENDANCFALAEAQAGAGKGAGTVFGVILGTGVGGGVVVNGRSLIGCNGIGGEWGHNPLSNPGREELNGPECYCGRRGCIEAWCSGPALSADHFRVTGSEMPAAMIASFAAAGDMAAKETLERHASRLGRALAGVVNILDPDVIVLGGGLSNLDHLYTELPGLMEPYVFSDVFGTPIRRNQMGDSAGVIGAAWLPAPKEAV
jgi:fructokinase